MPINAAIHDALDIRVHHFSGAVTPDELMQLARFYRANRPYVRSDLISIIEENAGGADNLLMANLPALRAEFRTLHSTSDLVIVRRSAWICPNPRSWNFLEAWLDERHSRDGQGTEVCLVPTLKLADCLFEPDEIRAVAEWRGFRELFSINIKRGDDSRS